MTTIKNITKTARIKTKPTNVSGSTWANAMNWTIEAWKCVLSGQKWAHDFEICCPEQYYMLLDKNGRFILGKIEGVKFANTLAIKNWVKRLEQQIVEMRAKGEWNESLRWSKLVSDIRKNELPSPNEDAFKQSKKVVKGHRLIRIKTAA